MKKIKQKETKSIFLKSDNMVTKVLLFIIDYGRKLVMEVDIRRKEK